MRSFTRLAATALAATGALAAATPAIAAPTQSATLTTAKPKFAWDGATGMGLVYTSTVSKKVGCNDAVFHCETILLNLPQAVDDLTVHAAGQGDTTKDVDLHLYLSDKDGTQGDLLYESAGETADETVATGSLDAGYYLAVVDYYLAIAGTYKGEATITPLGQGTPQETAAASKAPSKKRLERARARGHRRHR